MSPRSTFPLALLLLAVAAVPAAHAFTTGSPVCSANAAVMQAQHGGGVLAPGGINVSASSPTYVGGQAMQIRIEGRPGTNAYKGILLSVTDTLGNAVGTYSPGPKFQVVSVSPCTGHALTHTSNVVKSLPDSFTWIPPTGTGQPLTVNVVIAVSQFDTRLPSRITLTSGLLGVAPQPAPFHLYESRPDPFDRSTFINYSLAEAGPVDLTIADVSGRTVRHLEHGRREAGSWQVEWDGRDDSGTRVAPGVYFERLRTAHGTAATRVVVMDGGR